jgi:hypothetical protein
MNDYTKQAIRETAQQAKAKGFRVFIAERGTYGFFTDAAGSRVISFAYDLGTIKFSGNYKTNRPRQCGTGWVIGTGVSFAAAFNASAPQWATGGATWSYKTLAEYLSEYQSSSKFEEVGPNGARRRIDAMLDEVQP